MSGATPPIPNHVKVLN